MRTLDPNFRVPYEVAVRLGVPVRVDVRLGMDEPTDPLQEPGGYEYEISQEDRDILKAAIKDANNPEDLQREQFARAAIQAGLSAVPVYGPLLRLGGTLIMNWLGFGVAAEFAAQDASKRIEADAYDSFPGTNTDNTIGRMVGYVTSMKWDVAGDVATASITVLRRAESWVYFRRWESGNLDAEFGLNASLSSFRSPLLAVVSDSESPDGPPTTEHYETTVTRTEEIPIGSVCYQWQINDYVISETGETEGRTNIRLFPSEGCLPTEDGASWSDELGIPDLESIIPTGSLDPADSDLTPEELQNLITGPGGLKDSPWWEDYGREAIPPPAEPPPTQPPPPTGPPHPRDPGWPCEGGGIPGGPGSPGFPDPGSPGGPGDIPGGGLPGFPATPGGPDFPGGGFPGTPGGPGRLQIPGGPGPGRIEMPPFPCDDARYFPGRPIEAQIGEKKRKGRIAASDCENGVIIPEFPPFADEYFTKPWCRNNILVVDAVKELAGELGMSGADWVVDPDCKERWTGCFKKSSSKFDAMWKLADMCGYGLFPPGEEIGPMKPLPVFHGPYHEARDFWGYTTQKDNMDIPSHVEVFKPNVNGRGGFSIVLPVRTPYVPADAERWYSERIGPGVTRSMAENIALKKKSYFEIRAVAHDVVIPYNGLIGQRHQITLQRPSQGFTERSMVVSYEHEVDMESGAITKCVVSELSRSTYPKRDATFDEAWGGSLEAGINIPRTVDRR